MAFHARDELSPSHFSQLSSTIDLFHHFLAFRYGLEHRALRKTQEDANKVSSFRTKGNWIFAPWSSSFGSFGFISSRVLWGTDGGGKSRAATAPLLRPDRQRPFFLKPSSSLFFRGAIIPYSLSLKSQAGKEQQSTKNWRERREATTPFFRQEEKGGGATQFGEVLSLTTTLWAAASGQAILLPGEEKKIGKLVFTHHIFIWRNADNYGVVRREIVYANIHRAWCSSIRRLLLHGLETVARGSANNYYFHGRKGREGAAKHSHLQNGSEADFITQNQILKQHRDMVSHKNQGFFFHAHMTRHSKLDEFLSKHLCSKCFFSSLFTPAASIRRIHT